MWKNIEVHIKGRGYLDWTQLALVGDHWRTVVNMIMKDTVL
jgi:hypothetical protein